MEDPMRGTPSLTRLLIVSTLLSMFGLASCESGDSQAPASDASAPAAGGAASNAPAARAAGAATAERWSYHDWPTGPYRVVEGWPKPLPDTRHSHDGWTWGSFGGVYAESPDRIWIANGGELPLAAGAAP